MFACMHTLQHFRAHEVLLLANKAELCRAQTLQQGGISVEDFKGANVFQLHVPVRCFDN
jgi:hypothetical protein